MEGKENKSMEAPQDNKNKKGTDREPYLKNLTLTNKLILGALLLVVIGIMLTYLPRGKELLLAEPTFIGEVLTPVTETITTEVAETYEEALEMKLEAILGQLEGAGKARVMVTTSTSDEVILAEEVVECIQETDETDKSGGVKSNTKQDTTRKIVMQQGNTPIVIKENKPQIEGVLVLAEGADDSLVKNAIIQAVASVLDVPVHKIAVFKMATN